MQKRLFSIRAVPNSTAVNTKSTGWSPCMASSTVSRRSKYSTRSAPSNEPVVSVDWLYDNLKEPAIKVLALMLLLVPK